MTGWTELADGVWRRNYESLDFNVGVVAGDGGLLLIDTRADHVQARELQAHLLELSPLPVRWVVNTHYHWDHTWGNALFSPTPIWGHVRCAEQMRDNGEDHRTRMKEMAPEFADRFDAVAITPPDRTFSAAATIDLGNTTVSLRHLGLGHTDSDIVVQTEAGVLFAGDLVENGAPPSFGDAFPLDWPDTNAVLLDMVDGPVVPGHGGVADRAFVAEQHQELAELERLARERHVAGMTWEDAAAAGAPFPLETARVAFQRAYAQLEAGS